MSGPTEVTPEAPATSPLLEALSRFQQSLPSIAKAQEANVKSDKGNYSYEYANLTDISAIVIPKLASVGLTFTARTTVLDNGALVLTATLAHISGEQVASVYPLPNPTSSSPQQMGGAITYARRYLLCAMTGVAPGGEDNDAAGAAMVQEFLPEGLYDLRALSTKDQARDLFIDARAAGHLGRLMVVDGETLALGQHLTNLAADLPEAPPVLAGDTDA